MTPLHVRAASGLKSITHPHYCHTPLIPWGFLLNVIWHQIFFNRERPQIRRDLSSLIKQI